jgi:hypothetical protein
MIIGIIAGLFIAVTVLLYVTTQPCVRCRSLWTFNWKTSTPSSGSHLMQYCFRCIDWTKEEGFEFTTHNTLRGTIACRHYSRHFNAEKKKEISAS